MIVHSLIFVRCNLKGSSPKAKNLTVCRVLWNHRNRKNCLTSCRVIYSYHMVVAVGSTIFDYVLMISSHFLADAKLYASLWDGSCWDRIDIPFSSNEIIPLWQEIKACVCVSSDCHEVWLLSTFSAEQILSVIYELYFKFQFIIHSQFLHHNVRHFEIAIEMEDLCFSRLFFV